MRSGKNTYSEHYTPEEKEAFAQRCRYMLEKIDGDRDTLMSGFLGIYANPVDMCKRQTV
jgi:hypothetical protein